MLFNKSRHAGHFAAVGVATSCGVAGLARLMPLLGGVVAGGFDAALTHMIGRTAHRVFIDRRDTDASPATSEVPPRTEIAALGAPV